MSRKHMSIIGLVLAMAVLFSTSVPAGQEVVEEQVAAEEQAAPAGQEAPEEQVATAGQEVAQEQAAPEEQVAPADEAAGAAEELAEWTVMLYLCGADLESDSASATENLKQVAQTDPVPEVNFVIETGGAQAWHAQELGMDVDPSKLERWSYSDQGFEKVGETELASMGEKETLQDFLVWSREHYPAEKYQLILWDHGGASLKGVVFDQLFQNDSLQMYDLSSALAGSDMELEVFMTDTCLMANLETAEAIAPYARYFVGSEESLFDDGSNYKDFIQYLYDHPECDGASYGKRICSATEQMYSALNAPEKYGFLTMSLIDLAKVAPVREAFDDFIEEVDLLLDEPSAFYDYCYATRNHETYAYRFYADLYDLAERASGHGVSPGTARALQDAVEDAVVYNVHGSSHIRSHGISNFYSFNETEYVLDHYSRVCSDPIWLAFLDRLSYTWKAPDWVYESVEHKSDISYGDYTVHMTANVSDDGKSAFLEFPAEDGSIISASWELLQYDNDLNLWKFFGGDPFLEEENDETTYRLKATFNGTWPSLCNIPLKMNLIDEQDPHVLFTAPVLVNDYADVMKILYRLEGDYMVNEYDMIGSYDMDDHTGFPDRNTRPIAYGSSVAVLGTLMDPYDMGRTVDCQTEEFFTYEEGMEITREALPEGQYAICFVATDIFGNEHRSEMIYCDWDGKNVVYEQPEE